MMDSQTHPSISSPCCGNLAGHPLRLYIGSVTYFYQHIPIQPPCQMQHSSEGHGRKICCLPSFCPLHVFSRGRHSMGSLFPTHKQTHKDILIHMLNYLDSLLVCMNEDAGLKFTMYFSLFLKVNYFSRTPFCTQAPCCIQSPS